MYADIQNLSQSQYVGSKNTQPANNIFPITPPSHLENPITGRKQSLTNTVNVYTYVSFLLFVVRCTVWSTITNEHSSAH